MQALCVKVVTPVNFQEDGKATRSNIRNDRLQNDVAFSA